MIVKTLLKFSSIAVAANRNCKCHSYHILSQIQKLEVHIYLAIQTARDGHISLFALKSILSNMANLRSLKADFQKYFD